MNTLQLMRRIFLPLMALALISLSACQEPPTGNGPAGPGTVSGILNDDQGFIVPGATIEAIDAANTRVAVDVTTEDGAFALKGLPSDMSGIHMRVAHEGFKPLSAPIQEVVGMAGGPNGVLVSLLHADSCCAQISIAVSGANGVLLGGVEVKLRKGDRLITTGVTDSNGRLTFSGVCAGEFNLRLAKSGYNVVERGVNIRGCDTARLEFSMSKNDKEKEKKNDSCCRGYLRVLPLDSATGATITGAKVKIQRANAAARQAEAGGDGAIFREVCEGTYTVRIMKEGYRTVEFSVTMRCNDSVVTDRRMAAQKGEEKDSCCNGRLKIMLRDSTNNTVIGGAAVKLSKGDKVIGVKESNGDGAVVYEGLCQGEYQVIVEKTGYGRLQFGVALGCNQNLEITKKMLATGGGKDSCCNGVLSIVVRDSTTNAALANVSVKLWKNGVALRTGKTNANGVATFDGLCEGSYGVDLVREGYASREFQISLGCNQRKEVGYKMLATGGNNNDTCCNAVFRFRVKDSTVADGGWLSGVQVKIKAGDQTIATGETNAEGSYGREALCNKRTYTISFLKTGFKTKTITITVNDCKTYEETIRLSPN